MRDDEPGHGASDGEAVDFDALARLLPQRYPHRLIDRVVAFEEGSRLVARKGVTAGEPFFAGHFPGWPVMPGVLMCEALAQASALLVARSTPPPPTARRSRLTGLERVRFRQPVVPGDVLELDVAVLERAPTPWRFRGRVRVGDVRRRRDRLRLRGAGPGGGRDPPDGRDRRRGPRSGSACRSAPTR